MKARFMIENPDEIEATMKITMSVAAWGKLRDQLDEIGGSSVFYPVSELRHSITDLLTQARKVFHAEHETES